MSVKETCSPIISRELAVLSFSCAYVGGGNSFQKLNKVAAKLILLNFKR